MSTDLPAHSSKSAMAKPEFAVGAAIPANLPHAVSVSLPLWSDNIDYEEGRLSRVMETGYPRFFIHKTIQRLAAHFTRKFAQPHEQCILLPTATVADRCRDFIRKQHAKASPQAAPLAVRIVRFSILESTASAPGSGSSSPTITQLSSSISSLNGEASASSSTTSHYIFIVFFPADAFPIAKSFWQHTGDGISSRRAERCLQLLEQSGSLDDDESAQRINESSSSTLSSQTPAASGDAKNAYSGKRFYNRYARNGSASGSLTPSASNVPHEGVPMSSTPTSEASKADREEKVTSDTTTYLEERYGRNLPLSAAPQAKLALCRRIAGTLLSDRSDQPSDQAPGDATGETTRAGTGLTENDVYLFPSGMSSIYHAHQLAMIERKLRLQNDVTDGAEGGSVAMLQETRVGKSVCFGFPYTDTLKILQKWGPGCHFYGNGLDADLDEFEKLLEDEEKQRASASSPEDAPAPILALFCEFPSNPLLRSPDIARIRRLADKYGFLVVVDETIGNFVNVEVLPFTDMLVSSLTKVFSGDANVMGGSMVLNPKGPRAATLLKALDMHYEDTFFDEDALFLERNSRDFIKRVVQIDRNTQALTSMLHAEAHAEGKLPSGIIKNVFYPKYSTSEHYEKCRRKSPLTPGAVESGGFGGLFSLTFHSIAASQAFYDTLKCAKGPSLGTNYTLASPYTILAHYGELDWAAGYGVETGLVRVSVGLEPTSDLLAMFYESVKSAARAMNKL